MVKNLDTPSRRERRTKMKKSRNPRIIGVSASLRNARRGLGNKTLIDDIVQLADENVLNEYLAQEAAVHLKNFEDAGRKETRPFDEMYKELKRLKGDRGLSNSEIALSAALWSAHRLGAEIDHLSLSEYFSEGNRVKNLDDLKEKIMASDGFILSSPVYFGDRGSLSQSFIDWLRTDDELAADIKGKVYAGIAVGAKRNGGQETTLIYQLADMINAGMLGVGNDSETTSQYGGTGHAGDIGTMPKDSYGLATAMGTGRRIARVANMLCRAESANLKGSHKIVFWILQDRDEVALNYVRNLIEGFDNIDGVVVNLSEKNIMRCLACDICPTHVDTDENYRCIIKKASDDMEQLHSTVLEADAVIPVAFSPKNRKGVRSSYQQFIERTRYLRRGDYVMSDSVSAPIVIEELGAEENLPIRMMTSMIRHHTVIAKPIHVFRKDENFLNLNETLEEFRKLNSEIRRVAKARLLSYSEGVNHLKYNPVAYVLSAQKDKEDEKLLRRSQMIEQRIERSRKLVEKNLELI